jgi:surface-anchored protein
MNWPAGRRLLAAALTLVFSLALVSGAHAAGWQPLGQLSTSADNAGGPMTAPAPDGSTWLLWKGDSALEIQRVAADGTRGPLKEITTDFVQQATLAVESNGDALVAWWVSGSGAFVRQVEPDGTVDTTQPVGDSSAAGPLALGVDGSDGATIAYTEPDSTNGTAILYADRITAGVPAGSPTQISTNAHEGVETMSMAENPAGDVVLSWGFSNFVDFSFPDALWGRHIRRLAADGTLGAEHALGAMQLSSDTYTAPVMRPSGDAYVAYVQISASGGQNGDLQVEKLDTGDALSSVGTLDDEAYSISPGATMVSNSAGDLTVVWQRLDTDTSNIELASRRIQAGGTIEPPVSSGPDLLTPADHEFDGYWTLAPMPDGTVTSIWSDAETSPTVFKSVNIDPASGPAAPLTITTTTETSESLSAAADPAGDIFFAFDHTPDFSTWAVDGAFYDVQGPTVGKFAVPPHGTVGDDMVFGADATDRSGVQGYHWTFGDGDSADGSIADHTFTAPGTYTVTMTATDDANNTTTKTQSVVVRAPSSGGGNGGGSGTGTALVAKLTGLGHTLKVGSGHTLSLHLPAQAQDSFGSLTIRTTQGGAHTSRLTTIGKRSFPVPHGKAMTIRVKLTARSVKLAKRLHGRLRATVRLTLTGFDGTSAAKVYRVTLRG